MRSGLATSYSNCGNEGDNMRVFALLTGNRLGSHHLILAVETLMALTLVLLVARAVAQF